MPAHGDNCGAVRAASDAEGYEVAVQLDILACG